jgi:hypothetical protein
MPDMPENDPPAESVSDRAAEAVELYAARGFLPTRETRPLRSDPSLQSLAYGQLAAR